MKYCLFVLLFFTTSLLKANAQNTSYSEKVLRYIEQYKDWAMDEQIRAGIPASITLAQGILETAAGESELAENANNHFGIKCKSNWQGDSYKYTDDAKDECFRKYESAYHSYIDHSDFLRVNPRYKVLFTYDITDYKSWAIGLKKCGYATNPQYAFQLIKFIELYNLDAYTHVAVKMDKKRRMIAELNDALESKERQSEILDRKSEHMGFLPPPLSTASPKEDTIDFYVLTKKNGLNGFYAREGDLLLEYAIKSRIRYNRILHWNDLKDEPLESNLFIYLESKNKKGLKEEHIVKKGESLHFISQEEGIILNNLLDFNSLKESDQPVEGAILFLQSRNPNPVELVNDSKQKDDSRLNIGDSKEKRNQYIYSQDDEYIEVASIGSKSKHSTSENEKNTNDDKQIDAAVKIAKDSDKDIQEEKLSNLKKEVSPKPKKEKPEESIEDSDEFIDIATTKKNSSTINESDSKLANQTKDKTEEEKRTLTPTEKLQQYMDSQVESNLTDDSQMEIVSETMPIDDEVVVVEEEEEDLSNLSPLDRLKRYMDKSVYTNENNAPKKSSSVQNPSQVVPSKIESSNHVTTLPPAQQNKINNSQSSNSRTQTPAAQSAIKYYTVKKGDTAFSISKKFNITVSQLAKWNQLPASNQISIGQKLKVGQ